MLVTSRRRLLASGAAGIASLALPRGLKMAIAAPGAPGDILIVLFLRGGADGLSLVAPVNDPDYVAARPTLRVLAASSASAPAGLPLGGGPAGVDFRLHPSAPGLKALYDRGSLAIVHACGLPSASRSHFKSMDLMERGVADGEPNQVDGWLTRHLASASLGTGPVPVVGAAESLPASFIGDGHAVAIPAVADFFLEGDALNRATLAQLCSGASAYQAAGQKTVQALAAVYDRAPKNSAGAVDDYHPSPGVDYGNGELADGLKTVAQLIKLGVGLQVAALDFNDWDTHDDQMGRFQRQVDQLQRSLSAFWADIAQYQSRLILVAMTEFGRRVEENENRSTDHGHGSVMLVLGGNVNGGRIFGPWPGLSPAQLDQGLDLAITTDYRTVLSEILVRRTGNASVASVFPTVPYRPLGVVRGSDLGLA